ncbi:glycogen debranching N-terminal domain-containing protein [Plantactinospora solaniradicis]|uniref:Glycogen debranching N-terminal domain-containing protein n=1 Tax=Plantactinospora solaniradicis TaxID=1723736 RepID=A0ABW1K424_9ACTN
MRRRATSTTGRRPTPADPTPAGTRADRVGSSVARNLPPELGPDAVSVLEGRTFMVSNALGDVPEGSIGGLVHDDTRFLSRWELMINEERLLILGSGTVDDYSAAFFLTNPELPGLPANTIGIRRQRFVGDGMHERIELQSFADDPVPIRLRMAVRADFADLFEIKEAVRDRSGQITRRHSEDGAGLDFEYRNGTFRARTEVRVSAPATSIDGDDLVWDLELAPDQDWLCELSVPLQHGPRNLLPAHRQFGDVFDTDSDDVVTRWRAGVPEVRSDSALLCDVYNKASSDMTALRIEKEVRGQQVVLPAAGLPWFLTVFGRDTLICSYQTVAFAQRLAHGALVSLAAVQGSRVDDFSDEEPGKILHEVRSGELTRLGVKPHDPYYGAADATQLWLIVLSEYWRWSGDDDCVREMRDNAHAALRWIDEYGDRDGDGFVEYATRSPQGLGNQCWRDSWDGIQFADASIPVLPIATCETQGYTYDAKLRMAELADGPLDDPALAQRLRAEAAELRERFNRAYWIDERGGYYALGLDGDKRRIDMMSSNMGQLLWSGIVPPDRAATLARQLMSDQLFSGWGVRCTSTDDRGYNPIGYHTGTVWPHDNALIAYGLARYGFRQEANRIILAMMEAARFSEFRLPEALSGYDRSFGRAPVPYPTACRPQAWAASAPKLFLRTLLGLEIEQGRLVLDPCIPEEIGRIEVVGCNALGKRWDLTATGTEYEIRPAR